MLSVCTHAAYARPIRAARSRSAPLLDAVKAACLVRVRPMRHGAPAPWLAVCPMHASTCLRSTACMRSTGRTEAELERPPTRGESSPPPAPLASCARPSAGASCFRIHFFAIVCRRCHVDGVVRGGVTGGNWYRCGLSRCESVTVCDATVTRRRAFCLYTFLGAVQSVSGARKGRRAEQTRRETQTHRDLCAERALPLCQTVLRKLRLTADSPGGWSDVGPVATAAVSKRGRMRKKSAVGADRRTMCVLRYRAAARAP